MQDLEAMLQKEREARESAELLAKRLEQESADSRTNGFAFAGHKGIHISSGTKSSILEDAFDPPVEGEETIQEPIGIATTKNSEPTTESIEASTSLLQQRLDLMMVEMNEMKQHMELYKHRAETAEAERDADRLTLAEMIQKARATEAEEALRNSRRERSRSRTVTSRSHSSSGSNGIEGKRSSFAPLVQKTGARSGTLESSDPMITALASSRSSARDAVSRDQLLHHGTPYASMLGVVGLGLILMAYMNGWQKAER